jgi:hypothetical protein
MLTPSGGYCGIYGINSSMLRKRVTMPNDQKGRDPSRNPDDYINVHKDQLANLERDARRYQWLRSKAKRNAVTSNNKFAGDIHVIQWVNVTEANVLRAEELDAAVDAARQGKVK